MNKENEGKGVCFSNKNYIKGTLHQLKSKSHSIIAMNLETVEDVDKVIGQCELIKQEFAVQERGLKIVDFLEVPELKNN